MRLKISAANASVLAALVVLGSAVAHGAVKNSPAAAPAKAAKNDDAGLLEKHCSSCHAVDQVTAANKNAQDWAETMDRMIDHGMQITAEDNKKIQQFLVAHYGAK